MTFCLSLLLWFSNFCLQMYKLAIFYVFFQLSNALYTPVYFQEEEVRHVRAISGPKPPCEEDKLVELLAERQITSPESIVGIAIADFEGTCSATTSTLRKVDELSKNCTLVESLYTNLLSGLKTFDSQLCKNNDFYKKYDRYDKCYTDLNKDYEMCQGIPDWNEANPERVCKTYKKIVDCFYIKTAKVCGIKAALTLKELMVDVIDCALTVKCSVSSNPKIKDAMPEKYIDTLDKGPDANRGTVSLISLFLLSLIANILVLF